MSEPDSEPVWTLSPGTPKEWAGREQWPWQHDTALPPLAPDSADVQVFVRLDAGHAQRWRYQVTLNGTPVLYVPAARDPATGRKVGLLPVPTPHVTVRYIPREGYTEIAVTTE